MEKINFTNGQEPALNGTNLNQMQNNIENAMDTLKEELKLSILKMQNPIGHIRMETTDTNPADYLGFGTWVLWGAGRVPVGVDETQTEFETIEKTGGEKTHQLTTEEMPAHAHNETLITSSGYGHRWVGVESNVYDNSIKQSVTGGYITGGSWVEKKGNQNQTELNGGGQAHNNLQPYITCYMWKRTA